MKAFTTFAILGAAAVVSAQQPTFNNTSGQFDCPIANGVYCAGDSLVTNIIIRCTGTVGFPGNCNDNLAGEFPFGVNTAPCYVDPSQQGVAACSKNCVVYGGSGNINGTFTLPASQCTPSATPTSTSGTSSTSASSSPASNTSSTTAITTTTTTSVVTTSSSSAAASSTSAPSVTGTITSTPASNSTALITSATTGGSATATPVGPTTSLRPTFVPSSANANTAGAFVAAMGLLVAYLL